MVGIAVVAVAFALSSVAISSDARSGDPSPAKALASAVARSFHAKTARFRVSEHLVVAGAAIDSWGSGMVDLSVPASTSDVTMETSTGKARTLILSMKRVRSVHYAMISEPGVELTIGGAGEALWGLPPGKRWLSIPEMKGGAAASAALGMAQVDVIGALEDLERPTGAVRSLGRNRLDGQAVRRYAVVTTRSEAQRAIERSGLSDAAKRTAIGLLSWGPTTTVVAVGDRSGCVESITGSSVGFDSGRLSIADPRISFTNWGSRVGIIAPPDPAETEPIAALRTRPTLL